MASTSHLLVLQQLDVQISLRRPRRAGDVAQPCGGEVERGLTVRERAHDTRAPPDLAQDALERVVGANPPPVLLREGVVAISRTLVEHGTTPGRTAWWESGWRRQQSRACRAFETPWAEPFFFIK